MEKIPTAEEFLMKVELVSDINEQRAWLTNVKNHMIEFAKLHVEAALKEASEKAICIEYMEGEYDVKTDSILKAYPLNNIK